MLENGLLGKLMLISKSMTLQPGKQTLTIHILPIISRSKENQKMNFGQLIEYESRAERLLQDLFLFLKKLYVK